MQIIGVVNIWIEVLLFRETLQLKNTPRAFLSSALYNGSQWGEGL